ncbi:ADP-ribosylglycohydrolase family protein [Ruania halotolerans]|uniref:ADP-ribosylglycohydrolase family protein n=1 Tax=Ruania halotolerans TaxID=2897773 RepID=UPI001E2FD964|nr:ADP-ribosylglycohydrolase family protein [Ruania halotolerans]UFU07942.1 ADP-ribosylglycohydrolase family protein [Ruania halotolerans]
MRLTWAQPEDLVAHELVALAEQGADSAALESVARRWEAAGGSLQPERSGASAEAADPQLRLIARQVLAQLAELDTTDPAEPDDWADIAAQITGEIEGTPAAGERASFDRVAGAWWGRSVGCLLGKPVEKIPREGIEEIARATGNWPIRSYFTARGLPEDVAARWPWNRRSAPTSLVENIDGMPEDDDLNFPLLALDLLETHGDGLTTSDVAQSWLANLPGGRVFTAERAAYRNLLDARAITETGACETATHLNPFREWIGALIRADVYGWAHPGDVYAAARLAWVDARLSHTRNGIYGAMWAAALCSASLVSTSVDEVLDAAESVLPPASRLLEAVRSGRAAGEDLREGRIDDEEALDALQAQYGHLHWVHTLNNAALIAMAVAASGTAPSPAAGTGPAPTGGEVAVDDRPITDVNFTRGITLAVAAGWDTDSAGATVGSVLGALTGKSGLDPAWTDPLHGRLHTSLPGPQTHELDELASRTHTLSDRMMTS